jgi:nucleotide-binding universal stress UspA family protein
VYEKILVPLDGSKVGEAALADVEDMALKIGSCAQVEVTLLQVISELTYDFLTDAEAAQLPYDETDMKKIEQGAQRYLDKVAGRLEGKGIQVKTIIKTGHAAEQIIKVAQDIGADLIAMSTHGRSGLGRWALGSITDKVLSRSDIPVLTVRAKSDLAKARRK